MRTLHSDKEIKKWIDSKEAVAQKELSYFVCGYRTSIGHSPTLRMWWDYVLETKNWGVLKQYREKKINLASFKQAKFAMLQKIYSKDIRMKELGYKSIKKMLLKIYNVDISVSSVRHYLKIIRGHNEKISNS